MTDPMLQALREEIIALRELLDRVQAQATHDYEALAPVHRAVAQRQLEELLGYPLDTPTPATPESVDASCPF